MGWNFRKSVNIGPFRVTASQSGLSYSVGGKGLRVTRQADGRTRTTVSLPGTGISYSETAPAKAPRPARKERVRLCFDPELLRAAEAYCPDIRARLSDRRLGEEFARTSAPQWLRIAQDCAQLVNTTVKPDVFAGRYDLMESTLACLTLAAPYLSFSGTQPGDQLTQIINQRPEAERMFVQRAYDKMIEEARALKTPKGQSNKLVKFFDTMETAMPDYCRETAEFLQSLKERHIVR